MQLILRIVVLQFLLFTIVGVANELRVKGIRDLMINADSLEELDLLYKEVCNCFNYNQFEAHEEWQKIPESILDMTRDDLKTLIDLQMNKPTKRMVPVIKGDYNDMFCISETKEKFRVQGSTAVTWKNPRMPESFALKNLNIYDDDSGELVEMGTQTEYNTEFLLRLDDSFILDVKPFLNFQFQNSPQPELFFDYVKYAALHTRIIDSTGIKQAIKDWVDEVARSVNTLPTGKAVTGKGQPKEVPKTFDELFHDAALIDPCIGVLAELYPPLIDTDYNYIGTLKGVIVIWIEELQKQGVVKRYSDRKIYASLIPQRIKRFSIDESMFGKTHYKAESKYAADIKAKVSAIKLSQVSQKRS